MRKLILTALVAVAATACTKTVDVFTPYAETDLRLPSVPLIVNDPYFSIWSPYDKLTDGTTRHWTNDEKPILGLLYVDGTPYRFLGAEQNYILSAIAPMSDEEAWEGKVIRDTQNGEGWTAPSFDDSAWRTEKAAWGSEGDNIRSRWGRQGSDIYIRRDVTLSDADLQEDLYLQYSHDDVFELYINGTKVADTGETWVNGVVLHLDGDLKGLLQSGSNTIAAHCHNTTGGAYADFGLFKNVKPKGQEVKLAEQKSVDVLATNTYYTFACGPIELNLVFTAPMLIDDYDLISMPINYISYQVRATDQKKHDVKIYFGASRLLAVNKEKQRTNTTMGEEGGVSYVRTGTIEQPILAKTGDGICIDWGYFYIPAINGEVAIEDEGSTLAYTHDFGSTDKASSFMMMGYDEIEDIEYFFHRYKAYWAHGGKVTIFQAFKTMESQYASIMQRCRDLDKRIYDDGMKSGGKEYAEILSGSYRHMMAAHKLFEDKDGKHR